MSERLSITPLGPYIGAQISGADLTRPLSDNQFEQLYHAVLRHQVVFLRDQTITPQQQRALAQRFGELHIHPVYPHAEGVDEIIVLDTHNDNPPDNDNWHTDVTFIETYSAAIFLIPICISFDTAEKRRYATYLILNRRFSFEF